VGDGDPPDPLPWTAPGNDEGAAPRGEQRLLCS